MIHGPHQTFIAPIQVKAAVMIPVFILLWLWLVLRNLRKNQLSWPRQGVNALLLTYLNLLLSVTVFPFLIFPLGSPIHQLDFGKQTLLTELNPLAFLGYQVSQNLGNLIMLAPLTFLAPLLVARFQRFWQSLALGLLTSLSIECTQLLMNYFYLGNRVFDLSDLLLNTSGSLLGWLLFKLVQRWWPQLLRRLQVA
ncbi:VanZ family protein [Lapidilactobacillus achengensis]|uniref:VanZ family protein n=1 Tax=Lapidilactobacillus achengensis TaxID=2486000 RepID=A0ABW1UNV5_9LACO|nr:VanZ family protein [Lapidilactobacillus achengensis]